MKGMYVFLNSFTALFIYNSPFPVVVDKTCEHFDFLQTFINLLRIEYLLVKKKKKWRASNMAAGRI